MELLELIDVLTEKIQNASTIPLSGKSLIDKEDILDLIESIKLQLPDDLKQAKWIKESRNKILSDAEKEANEKIEQAKNQIITMMSETEITRQAKAEAEKIINQANLEARQIKSSSNRYTDSLLEGVGQNAADTMDVLNQAIEGINSSVQDIQHALATIDANRQELAKRESGANN